MRRRDEALKALTEARKVYEEVGVHSHNAKAVVELIERLEGSRPAAEPEAADAEGE